MEQLPIPKSRRLFRELLELEGDCETTATPTTTSTNPSRRRRQGHGRLIARGAHPRSREED
jgi:hypothetical protein